MHEDTRRSIDRFYQPRTVALIGVSSNFGFGHGLPRFLIDQGWGDRIYPVNPNVEEIAGIRAYPSLRDVPVDIDLACILVPAPLVEGVLEECVAKGVKAVIVMSAGFAETGPEGQRRQDSLAAIARDAGIRMIGPNCIGVVDVPNGFATVEILLRDMQPGNISIVAQSGVFGNILLDGAPAQGIRIAKVATIGNRADLDETDFLSCYGEDTVILQLVGIAVQVGVDDPGGDAAAAARDDGTDADRKMKTRAAILWALGCQAGRGLPVPGVMITAEDVANGKPDPEPYLASRQGLAGGGAAVGFFSIAPGKEFING